MIVLSTHNDKNLNRLDYQLLFWKWNRAPTWLSSGNGVQGLDNLSAEAPFPILRMPLLWSLAWDKPRFQPPRSLFFLSLPETGRKEPQGMRLAQVQPGCWVGCRQNIFYWKKKHFSDSNYTLSPTHLVETLNIWTPWHLKQNGSPTLVSWTDFISNKWGPLSLFQIEFPYKKYSK